LSSEFATNALLTCRLQTAVDMPNLAMVKPMHPQLLPHMHERNALGPSYFSIYSKSANIHFPMSRLPSCSN
jgi:hypothetical protein